MANPMHQFARDFFAAFFRGELPDNLVAPDISAWTTVGPVEGEAYRASLKHVINLFVGGKGRFDYVIDAITAEEDRVVVEIHATGVFVDGETYENTYVFVLRLREGRVVKVSENFNPLPFFEKMLPRLQAAGVILG